MQTLFGFIQIYTYGTVTSLLGGDGWMPFNGPHLEFAESLDLFNVRLIQSSKLMTAGAATAGAKRASITFSLMSVDSTHPMLPMR